MWLDGAQQHSTAGWLKPRLTQYQGVPGHSTPGSWVHQWGRHCILGYNEGQRPREADRRPGKRGNWDPKIGRDRDPERERVEQRPRNGWGETETQRAEGGGWGEWMGLGLSNCRWRSTGHPLVTSVQFSTPLPLPPVQTHWKLLRLPPPAHL